ncbi:MAG TPA: galactose-1-epimerase [Clostridiales bacterium]|nr:galactose-1-epimerase [Clostridiales bacterium]
MSVTIKEFGKTRAGQIVHSFTLYQDNGTFCTLISYGGAVQSLLMPDRSGRFQDIVLGYDDMAGYEGLNNPYHGALIGRHGNRIEDACFEIDGRTYHLARNDGRNHLHGGLRGFDKQIWQGEPVNAPEGPAVCFRYRSPDGDEGYPGNLDVEATYVLTADQALIIRYRAVSDQKTVINLTNHSYFNLAGQGSGTILAHQVQIEADEFTAINQECNPTGEIIPVAGTALDFRQMKPIGRDIGSGELQIINGLGYDHNFILRDKSPGRKACAAVYEPKFGRVMTVETTSPGVQLYTGNFMKPDTGKEGVRYDYRNGFCLETQYFPNSLKHKNFPSPIFAAGEVFSQETVYRFSAR